MFAASVSNLLTGSASREDHNQGALSEGFTYDNLYRLIYSNNGATSVSTEYDAIGNITKKTDVHPTQTWSYVNQAGCPAYTHAQPHAVRKINATIYCYDANGNMTKRGSDDVTWYSYNLPQTLEHGSSTSTLYYGANRQRYKQVSNGTTTLYVGGLFEKITPPSGPTQFKLHVFAAGQRVAVETRRSDITSSTAYLLPDHLGSVDVIADSSGSWTNLSYDPFGERRRSDWTDNPPDSGEWTAINGSTHRGYTDHESLDDVALVHMNGRVYDPKIGRFLSADPFVPNPGNGQSFNRYSYVHNDPLSFFDPTGFWGEDIENARIQPGFSRVGNTSNATRSMSEMAWIHDQYDSRVAEPVQFSSLHPTLIVSDPRYGISGVAYSMGLLWGLPEYANGRIIGTYGSPAGDETPSAPAPAGSGSALPSGNFGVIAGASIAIPISGGGVAEGAGASAAAGGAGLAAGVFGALAMVYPTSAAIDTQDAHRRTHEPYARIAFGQARISFTFGSGIDLRTKALLIRLGYAPLLTYTVLPSGQPVALNNRTLAAYGLARVRPVNVFEQQFSLLPPSVLERFGEPGVPAFIIPVTPSKEDLTVLFHVTAPE